MQQTELSGILLMDKPQGFTSHDVVAKLRGILHTRKIGHGGTLDPLATGVLPVFIGGATKAADFAAAQDKEYVAGFTLGYCTDTQDVTGEIVQTGDRIAGGICGETCGARLCRTAAADSADVLGGQGQRPEAVRPCHARAGRSNARRATSSCMKWSCWTSTRTPRRVRCAVWSARAPMCARS